MTPVQARGWQVHVASAFPLAHHYRAAFGLRHTLKVSLDRGVEGVVCSNPGKWATDLATR